MKTYFLTSLHEQKPPYSNYELEDNSNVQPFSQQAGRASVLPFFFSIPISLKIIIIILYSGSQLIRI